MKSPKTIVLDLDDFSVIRNKADVLKKLKEHYPALKVSLFTIPFDYEYEMSPIARIYRQAGLQFVQENKDWLEFIPHGILHAGPEFETMDKEGMRNYLDSIEDEFAKDGIEIVKGFKAPHWVWNQDVVDVLDEYGWFGGVDPNQPQMPRPKKYYEYSHSIDTPFWESENEVLKLHGHMTLPSANNLDDCLLNLMKMPVDAEFKFVSEMVEQ